MIIRVQMLMYGKEARQTTLIQTAAHAIPYRKGQHENRQDKRMNGNQTILLHLFVHLGKISVFIFLFLNG